jgi:hypothetical protein
MGWALRVVADVVTLPRGLLNAGLMGAVFASGEAVDLDWSPLPLDFASPLSDVLKHTWPPTVVLAARAVTIESLLFESPDGPAVQARGLGTEPWDGEESF